MKAPTSKNVNRVGDFDVAKFLGVPQRFPAPPTAPGTRFGPRAIRRISALYTP